MARIGSRGPDIFPLVLGGNVFGWTADREASFAILDAFVAGISDGQNAMIDTAEGYSLWVEGNDGYDSERIIGEWIRDRRPQNVLLATKTGGHRAHKNLEPARVKDAVDASIERLGVEFIDLYWAHYDDENETIETQVATFAEILESGRAKAIGLSNYTPARLREWLETASRLEVDLPVAFQPHYNLVHRNDVEDHIIPIAEEHGIGLLPYYALASGFLTGKYRSTPVPERAQRDEGPAAASPRSPTASKYATEQGFAIIDELERIGSAHGASIATTALAWLRHQPTVAAPIASASRPDQIPDLLASATLDLTTDDLLELDRVSAWTPPIAG